MTERARHIISWIGTAVMLVLTVVLFTASRLERHKLLCDRVEVELPGPCEFVTEDQVRSFLDDKYGPCIGARLDSIDLGRIESLLESKPVVVGSEAWTTCDGVLHVSVSQRMPALRFKRADKGFYMDEDGFIFPLHPSYTAEVPLIEGDIPSETSESWQEWSQGVLAITRYMEALPRWKDSDAKILVATGGDIVLCAPDGGKELFIIGRPEGTASKFERIELYYSHIKPNKPGYASVNLKYNKQIICRKDI
ncbi:MAG: hypothetical protein IJS66_07600 [Bacteroidales bacterium]|nr:hypothetical protein [Bacteroidales bacterium]